jgi:hypothetical protein
MTDNKDKKTEAAQKVQVKFNTDQLKSSYANFCNVTSTQEEVVLNFGINSDWDRSALGGQLEIDLTNRIILSPFAAKRLSRMLNNLIEGYETKYAPIGTQSGENESGRVH